MLITPNVLLEIGTQINMLVLFIAYLPKVFLNSCRVLHVKNEEILDNDDGVHKEHSLHHDCD